MYWIRFIQKFYKYFLKIALQNMSFAVNKNYPLCSILLITKEI